MSRTLNLADALLLKGRRHLACGQLTSALRLFTRLTSLSDLPEGIAEETQSRLAEIQLRRGKLRRACRHLTAALQYDPDNADYHFRLASALHRRGGECWERAAGHYRRALQLHPGRIAYLTAAGLLAIRRGSIEEGIGHLREAVDARPADPTVLRKLIKGLRLAGLRNEARQELRAAQFRNPRDLRFRQLADSFAFRELWLKQQENRATIETPDEMPVVLPFVPVPASAPRKKLRSARILRHDGPSPFPPPNAGTLRFPARRN